MMPMRFVFIEFNASRQDDMGGHDACRRPAFSTGFFDGA
jgi:hypothetical protein